MRISRVRSHPADDDDRKRPPSRAEIEELCILHAVALDGCSEADLAFIRVGS